MENPVVAGLRSRSRSKTPSHKSSVGLENSGDTESNHKSNRKVTTGGGTPTKLAIVLERATPDRLTEEELTSPAHRTRSAVAATAVTSDYSSEENLDKVTSKEHIQNQLNSKYEYSRVTTTSSARRDYQSGEFHLSPSKTSSPYTSYNASLHRSHSPAHSACSTDSSFAELALADVSKVTETEGYGHLPYKLYKMAGEYWNKYPKTDYTYSVLSRDRVELAPGQVAVPNMSRRSLAQYRAQGDLTSTQEMERLLEQHGRAWRTQSYDSSDDECIKRENGGALYRSAEQRWWLIRALLAVYTTITTAVSDTWQSVKGGDERRYPVRTQPSTAARVGSAMAAPLVWIIRTVKTIVTTTTTTITNTVSGTDTTDGGRYRRYAGGAYAGNPGRRRRLWPWLLLLPLIGYACYYTYENFDNLSLPDLSDYQLDLTEFSVPLPSIPELSLPFALPAMPNLTMPDISMPDISMPMPDFSLPEVEMPEMPASYYEYKDYAQDRFGEAAEYMKVVGESCAEEVKRFWKRIF